MKKISRILLAGMLLISSLVIPTTAKAEQDFYEVNIRRSLTNQGSVYNRGNVYRKQNTPVAKTAAATITVADMLNGIVTINQTTSATVALTVDTGSKIEAGLPTGFAVGDSFEFTIINLDTTAAANTATLTAATGVTLVGAVIIPSAHSTTVANSSMRFRVRKTATNTFVIYRV